jgi:integrase
VPRARSGTLLRPGMNGYWRGRVTVEQTGDDGATVTTRPVYSLGTADKQRAKRELAKLVADLKSGKNLDAARERTDAASVAAYAPEWLLKREAQAVMSVRDERRNLEHHVLPDIGHLSLGDVGPPHISAILDKMALKPRVRPPSNPSQARSTYSEQSVKHVRGAMFRMFEAARLDGRITHNPAAGVPLPRMKEVKKPRVILTDDEFARYIAHAPADLELRMLSVVARCEGGMRTGDLNRWDWTDIDRVTFAHCTIPRVKANLPQTLAVPPSLVPHLRAWWMRAGRPESGAVFPSRRGKRAGSFRAPRGQSFASRLRRDLFRAGVFRVTPIEVPATQPGTRSDLGRHATGTKLSPNPLDPLYYEQGRTLPVDFHSFRRAYNTALAASGINVQHSMRLAGHSDARTHMKYVMDTPALQVMPEAALPVLPAEMTFETSRAVTIQQHTKKKTKKDEQYQRATQESNLRPTAPEAVALSS